MPAARTRTNCPTAPAKNHPSAGAWAHLACVLGEAAVGVQCLGSKLIWMGFCQGVAVVFPAGAEWLVGMSVPCTVG